MRKNVTHQESHSLLCHRDIIFESISHQVLVKKQPQPLDFTGIAVVFNQAENGTRTHDPFITSEVLYQLSYFSIALRKFHYTIKCRNIKCFLENSIKILLDSSCFSEQDYSNYKEDGDGSHSQIDISGDLGNQTYQGGAHEGSTFAADIHQTEVFP